MRTVDEGLGVNGGVHEDHAGAVNRACLCPLYPCSGSVGMWACHFQKKLEIWIFIQITFILKILTVDPIYFVLLRKLKDKDSAWLGLPLGGYG